MRSATYMSTSTSCPDAVLAAVTLKPQRILAMFSATELAPTCMPGHILRPHPKALCPNVPG